jgi:hypothetical protein
MAALAAFIIQHLTKRPIAAAPGSAGTVLLESGDDILMENSDRILNEAS